MTTSQLFVSQAFIIESERANDEKYAHLHKRLMEEYLDESNGKVPAWF